MDNNYIPRLGTTERYDDGVAVDYAAMIRMWSAFDRSIARFNRECGLPPIGPSAIGRSMADPQKPSR